MTFRVGAFFLMIFYIFISRYRPVPIAGQL
nr:MAG TPA: hypothetical protein [Caudoviricetes sp.]